MSLTDVGCFAGCASFAGYAWELVLDNVMPEGVVARSSAVASFTASL